MGSLNPCDKWKHRFSALPAEALPRSQLTEEVRVTHWLFYSVIHQSPIFHKHYLPATISGLGRGPSRWFSSIGCKPDASRATGHVFKNTCRISDGLICWIYWVWNCFSTNLIKKKPPEGKYTQRGCGSKTEATEAQGKHFSSTWVWTGQSWPCLVGKRARLPPCTIH